MAKCKHCGCGEVATSVLAEYVDDLMGAPFHVVLENAVLEERCAKCRTKLGIVIPDLEGLVAAVAMTRALDAEKLSGDEIKFMRKAIGWKAKELAAFLQVSAEHISRCESGPLTLSDGLEKYLRHYACEKIKKKFVIGIHLDIEVFELMRIRPRLRVVGAPIEKYRFIRVPVPIEKKKTADGWDRKAA